MNHEHEEQFRLNVAGAHATGIMTGDGFLVLAGATAAKPTTSSGIDPMAGFRKRLFADGVLVESADGIRFSEDYLFKTPSAAAGAVLGRAANGWTEWKTADGETLSRVKHVSRDVTTSRLDNAQRNQLISAYRERLKADQLPTQHQLDKEYALFRERFGPSVLKGMDGEPLLMLMHNHSSRDSLVYWLEYKSDEEFQTGHFGGIAGGSALKFRIFRRKETGSWQAAGEGNRPTDITQDEAIEFARSHRDQLLRGVELLERLPPDASDDDYALLQDQMDELAPDVSRLGWGHKYFTMLFPTKLDDFQSHAWQSFHLLKLLQRPPDSDGRYICAGRFVSAAKDGGMPMNHFTDVLNFVHGALHGYWRIGLTAAKADCWPSMKTQGFVALGAPPPGTQSPEGNKRSGAPTPADITRFQNSIRERDIVLAADEETIVGIGRVIGDYEHLPESEFPHRRQVDWIAFDEWKMPVPKEGSGSAVRRILKYDDNILAIERRLQRIDDRKPAPRLSGISGRIQSVLDRKGQVILYGPPGTGKTFWAEQTANDLASLAAFNKTFASLDETERAAVRGQGATSGLVRLCCFHPAYGYEDFLEGYRPQTTNGQVSFALRDGVFKTLCKDAEADPGRSFYLIVDEINRGDIPRIFGELLTTLEKDKRGKRIILPVSQELFSVPRNVFLLGTMNTADRSISLLDAALRRRFGFVEMMPDGSVLADSAVSGIPLRAWLDALNARIREYVGRDARNLQIGHSYLMQAGVPLKDMASLRRAIRDDIIPLLEEYCYEDYGTLGNLLGEQIVDVAAERIRHELFDDGHEPALIQGLLAPFADISTSTGAIISDESEAEINEDDEEGAS